MDIEYTGNFTLDQELQRTAELLVEINSRRENNGVYFIVAFLMDAGYDLARIRKLLPYIEKQRGGITRVN